MSWIHDPFDPDPSLRRCSCGKHASQAEHEEELAAAESYRLRLRLVEVEPARMQTAASRVPFPQNTARRDWRDSPTRTIH